MRFGKPRFDFDGSPVCLGRAFKISALLCSRALAESGRSRRVLS